MRAKRVAILKHTALVGIAVLCTPLAGCGSFESIFGSNPETALFHPEKKPAPEAGAQAAAGIRALPTDIDGAIKSAQDARKNGQFEAATKMLAQIMLVAPDDARVVGEYGKALAAQGRSDDAIAFLERATQLQPGDWTLFSAQGVAYDQKGVYKAAQESYARALILKPDEPTVLNNDALSHALSGDLDGAERLLRSAGPAAQSDPRIAKNLALVQSLRAAQAEKTAPAAAPAAPAAVPAPAVAQNPTPPAPPQNIVSIAPAVTPAASQSDQVAAPLPPGPPVEAVALASPATEQAVPVEALKADPTVVMQPLPAERSTEIPPPAPAKTEVAAPKVEKASAHTPIAMPAADPAPPVARTAAASKAYFVQAGAFGTEARAGKAASGLESLGARVTPGSAADGHAVYRVRIGPFLNRQQANVAVGQAHELGHADVIIVAE
jgi:Flp pilus assembly protein TadD